MGLESVLMLQAWLNVANSDFCQSDPTVQPSELCNKPDTDLCISVCLCVYIEPHKYVFVSMQVFS